MLLFVSLILYDSDLFECLVTSERAAANGAGDGLTAPSTPEVNGSAHHLAVNINASSPLLNSRPHELQTCEGGSGSEVTEGHEKNGSDVAAAERSAHM